MEKIIESLRSFYKEPFLKLVVYVDGSGYVGAINGKRLFEFDNLAKLESLEMLEVGDFSPTMRAADTCPHCGRIRKPIDISDEDYFCQRQGMCR